MRKPSNQKNPVALGDLYETQELSPAHARATRTWMEHESDNGGTPFSSTPSHSTHISTMSVTRSIRDGVQDQDQDHEVKFKVQDQDSYYGIYYVPSMITSQRRAGETWDLVHSTAGVVADMSAKFQTIPATFFEQALSMMSSQVPSMITSQRRAGETWDLVHSTAGVVADMSAKFQTIPATFFEQALSMSHHKFFYDNFTTTRRRDMGLALTMVSTSSSMITSQRRAGETWDLVHSTAGVVADMSAKFQTIPATFFEQLLLWYLTMSSSMITSQRRAGETWDLVHSTAGVVADMSAKFQTIPATFFEQALSMMSSQVPSMITSQRRVGETWDLVHSTAGVVADMSAKFQTIPATFFEQALSMILQVLL
ncbi:hypothetical protein B0O80DRAFT_531281 [Mortierella sp. GBAus27b]|nr:hypothetical protein B0O80DRAFT_531281 [Mortierella sp. GBAus27b]